MRPVHRPLVSRPSATCNAYPALTCPRCLRTCGTPRGVAARCAESTDARAMTGARSCPSPENGSADVCSFMTCDHPVCFKA
ncbi:hypothetical protein DA2_0339 [Desulfovibrio sp. A2]|nr:hypothetical protein DA2_0339 [Desulfovibrio sp. A2]